jgi:hypothetical protein
LRFNFSINPGKRFTSDTTDGIFDTTVIKNGFFTLMKIEGFKGVYFVD